MRIAAGTLVVTPQGSRYAHEGDVLLTAADGSVADLLPENRLHERYEPIMEGELLLGPEHITRIAKVLRFGATKTANDLTKAIEQMAAVRIGGIKIEFTPAQVEQIKLKAERQGWTPEKYVQHLVDRFTIEMFNL